MTRPKFCWEELVLIEGMNWDLCVQEKTLMEAYGKNALGA